MADFDACLAKLTDEILDPLRAERYGDLNLNDAVEYLIATRHELERAAHTPASMVPPGFWDVAVHSLSREIDAAIAQMRQYADQGPTGSNPAPTVTALAQKAFASAVREFRPYAAVNGEALAAARAEYETAAANLEALRNEFAAAVEPVRDHAATKATSDLAKHYEAESDANEEDARKFRRLGWTGVAVLAGLAVLSLLLPLRVDPNASGGALAVAIVHDTLGRALLLSLAAYVAAFGFRNYRVNMHLHTLNVRRTIALKTSDLLREATSDPSARNIIVAELVRAIFAGDETGYLGETDRTIVESSGTSVAGIMGLAKESS